MKKILLLVFLFSGYLMLASCSKQPIGTFPPVADSSWLTKPRGVVVETFFGCPYYIVQTNRGFSVMRNLGGGSPFSGTVIYGPLHQWGVSTFYNRSSGFIFQADVSDFGISYWMAMDAISWNCGSSFPN